LHLQHHSPCPPDAYSAFRRTIPSDSLGLSLYPLRRKLGDDHVPRTEEHFIRSLPPETPLHPPHLREHCPRRQKKSLRWVADQLGHQNPEFTLRTYAHLMPQEETDLSFADFGGPGRPCTATPPEAAAENKNAPATSGRGHSVFMEHETRFELVESIASATAS
jgi:hypothetical protein